MRIFIFSGAGLDAESGIQTFRDTGGTWHQHDLMKVCSIDTFEENYELCHEFYNQRRVEMNNVEPNSAHYKIAELCKKYEVENFTANVSDLLERAGVPDVCHIHGNLMQMAINYPSQHGCEIRDIGYTAHELVPGRIDKPNVVFFGEGAPMYQPFWGAIDTLTEEDIAIVVGSTLEVNPIHYDIAATGAKFILINPQGIDTDGTSNMNDAIRICDVFINLPATKAFDEIEAHIENHISNHS
ncbi:Sir2 family protein [Vibrio phage 1.081.O._10N.286.52.C2]|nr:Sir2 family protein [Vibrio phage 1.081.O._10N.286.52.C2]